MMLHQYGIQDHDYATPDDPDFFIVFNAYFTMMSGLIFIPVECHICQPVSGHGL